MRAQSGANRTTEGEKEKKVEETRQLSADELFVSYAFGFESTSPRPARLAPVPRSLAFAVKMDGDLISVVNRLQNSQSRARLRGVEQ